MPKKMLRGIRVKSKEELVLRIYLYIDEINAQPVVFQLKHNIDDKDVFERLSLILYRVKSLVN